MSPPDKGGTPKAVDDLLHPREDGTDCGYVALGGFCSKCGWTPLRSENLRLTREVERLRTMLDHFDRYASIESDAMPYNGSPFQAEVRAVLDGK